MSSVNLNGKRRRIEAAASSLAKPFKSPLRKPVEGTVDNEKASNNSSVNTEAEGQERQYVDGKNAQEHLTPSSSISSKPTSLTSSSPASPFPSLQNRKRKPTTNQMTLLKKSLLVDPVISELQKEQRALQSRLSALRSELDTVQQALRIESSTKDAELETLILKWKTVSQEAAEEVFEGAQERVARMGGMKAWRERMQSDSARWEQEEMNSWHGNAEVEGFEMDEGELEQRKAELIDEVEMPRKEQEVGTGGETAEDEEFTMDIMLKTLNIDLKMIGYDKSTQRWIK
ncbi:swi5-dependent recombination DNA repair protein 1 [Aspergillus udagawae]|uniref:Swi5-dependent recombination DNA repair protein 1 n=1 Tax=Aspergillus udagawae TaxID=91492 RepID=A0ABQ0ZZ92_9EURO|nr:swi5-dependent recombination DNA repair protein 1 [Aspergillus udagawae]GFG23725.1 swi5-dependent recombination DNA repair protein 1 [Aspergillus udagawae]